MSTDPSGEALLPSPRSTKRAVREALRAFEGTFLQTPPPFSAKKIGGTPAYKLARQDKPVEIKPVEVTVRELELRGYADGLADVRLVSSSGFYVRSLAHDLGQRLGCGAHLEGLRRTRAGEFTLDDAVALEAVVVGGLAGRQRTAGRDGPAPDDDARRGRQRPGRQARESWERPAARRPCRSRPGCGWFRVPDDFQRPSSEAPRPGRVAPRAGRTARRRAFASAGRSGVRC